MTRVRWPHGVEDQMFFEKNLPSGAPSWLPRVPIDDVTYPLITDLADLTYLVNLNSLEVHVPQWTVDDDGRAAATPTGSSSTSTPASRPGCTSARRSRCSCATGWRPSGSTCTR